MDRRTFVKTAGAAAATGAGLAGARPAHANALVHGTPDAPGQAPAQSRRLPDVIVVGAGAMGGWTALNLQQQGVRVRLIDAWGPGNSRSTSGDETRGIRSSYGDRAGEQAAQWGAWAKRAMKKWRDWDATWGREMKIQLFFQTGDLIMRPTNDAFIRNNRAMWDKIGANYMVLSKDEVMYRYPQYNVEDMEYFLFEPEAGFARARRSCEAVAGVFKQFGGELVITRAWPTTQMNGKMTALQTSNGEMMSAGTYLFACGPWLRKVFPVLMGNRLRTPMGSVYYFGAPTGEQFRKEIEAPFFAYWLKDKGTATQGEARVWESGGGTGAWRTYSAWPPKEATTKALYFGANGTLSFDAPAAGGAPALRVGCIGRPYTFVNVVLRAADGREVGAGEGALF